MPLDSCVRHAGCALRPAKTSLGDSSPREPEKLGTDDAVWTRMHASFTDSQIVDLTVTVTQWHKRETYLAILNSGGIASLRQAAPGHLFDPKSRSDTNPIGSATLGWLTALGVL